MIWNFGVYFQQYLNIFAKNLSFYIYRYGLENTKVGNILLNMKILSDKMDKLIVNAEFNIEFDEFEDLCKILVAKSQNFKNDNYHLWLFSLMKTKKP